MSRILVVDDEPRYLHLLRINLESEGYEVVTAANGEEALEIVSSQSVDLVLLDIMMPRLDGFSTCERIRQFSNIPVIMLSAKVEEKDRVAGLDTGADDYITKPFSATELLARVRAALRRSQVTNRAAAENSRFFEHGGLTIDFARTEVSRSGKPIPLSATEYRLLVFLAQNIGKVLSTEQLLANIWGQQYKNEKEILWVTIARLRQKLEENPHSPQHILTRSGLGYYMPAEVKQQEDRKENIG